MLRPVFSAFPATYWLLAFLLVLLLPPMLTGPFGADQGIFAYVGQTILQGGAPYRDAWDIKGPLVYLVYAGGQWLTPGRAFGTLLFDVLLLTSALCSICALAQRLHSSRLLGPTACILLLASGALDLLRAGQPDTWAGYLSLMLAALLAAPPSLRHAALSGVLIGIMVLLKPHYILLGLLSGAFLLQEPKRWQLLALHTLAGLGMLLAGAAYIHFSGAGPAFLELVQFYASTHLSDEGSADPAFMLTRDVFYNIYMLCLLAALLGCTLLYKNGHKRLALLLGLLLTLQFVILFVQGKFYTYQRVPLLMTAALPIAWLLERLYLHLSRLLDNISLHRLRWQDLARACLPALPFAALWFAFFFLLFTHYVTAVQAWVNWTGVPVSPAYGQDHDGQEFIAGRAEAVAFVQQHTPPGAPIYVFGFDAGIYAQSQRRAATRFGYSYPLVSPTALWRERYRQTLLEDLVRTKPAALIINRQDANPVTDPKPRERFLREGFRNSEQMLHTFPALEAYIAQHYRLAQASAHNLIYLPR